MLARVSAQVRRTASREDRRQALVAAAYQEIAERGFEGLRTREVAAQAGVNVATLHYYFPSKEALIRAVLGHAMQRFRTTLAPHGSPADQLGNHFRGVRALLRAEPELRSVMGELALRATRDRTIAGIMRQTDEAWYRTLRGLLHRAAQAGHLRPELDTDDVAALVMTAFKGMTIAGGSADRMDQAIRQLERWLGPPAGSRRTRERRSRSSN
jgi:AcrR family transcriptional regulator